MHDNLDDIIVDGITVEVAGYYDENTAEGAYVFYDLFVEGVCINFGNPLYEKPTIEIARVFLKNRT